jgi:L-2,4-diaminobutyrate decarboxylase
MEKQLLDQARDRISSLYAPQRFSTDGAKAMKEISRYLEQAQAGESPVLNWREPKDNIRRADQYLDGGQSVEALCEAALNNGQTIQNPMYMGHQVSAPVPASVLFEAVSAITNQGMTVYEMGPWSSAVERSVIQRIGHQLGLPPGFGGVLTHGGSLANLTALLAARNRVQVTAWTRGASGDGVLLVSEESHYSVEKAAGIMGLGTENCLQIPVTSDFKMDVVELELTLARLKEQGRPVIAVVASATSTRTGTYDPLMAIGQLCRRYGVWFHVDGAHGAAAVFSERYGHFMAGVELADSVSLDAHKMMYMPALSTYLFYQRGNDQYLSVNQEASYLFETDPDVQEKFDTGLGTIECTKRAAALSLWATWSLHGQEVFADLVDVTYATARQIADAMRESDEFDLINEPESNVIVFRYLPPSLANTTPDDVGDFQRELRHRLIRSGVSYIVPAMAGGTSALRLVVMNPMTTLEHFRQLHEALRSHSNAIASRQLIPS